VAWRAVVAFAAASDCVCMAVVHDGMVTGLCAAEDDESVSLLEVYQRAVAVYPPLGATLATNVLLDGATAAAIVAAGSAQWAAVLAPEIDDDALDMFRSSEEQDAAQAAAQGRRRTTEEMTLLEVPLVLSAAQEEEDDEEDEDDEGAEDDAGAEAAAAAGKEPRRPRSGVVLDALDLVPLTGGGLLVREPLPPREQASWTVVSDERPTAEELRDLVFGWRLLPHLPHGAIVLCVERQMISPAYTWADQAQGVELALRVAGAAANGAILACDAPLTSTSAVELAAAGGVVAVVQPGGAARDSAL
jgi:AICAR transformylase/IMP cyclohydrolase PurH